MKKKVPLISVVTLFILLLIFLVVLRVLPRFTTTLRAKRISSLSTEQLIIILKDPDSPDFTFATSELTRRGPEAASAAPTLARALQYPRRDSNQAGIALAAMGPAAKSAIPDLLQALESDRPDVRRYAAFVLGMIGKTSKCAVPELAQLLWDSDMWVRSTAAGSLEAITGEDLAIEIYALEPSTPGNVYGDEPEGHITDKARIWWKEEGQYMNWLEGVNYCGPPGSGK
jgi:hypothetical protein